MSEDKIKLKQARNLFNALTRNEKSIFYGADRIINNLVKKAKKSDYQKYKAFFTLCKNVDEKNNQEEIYFAENKTRDKCASIYAVCRAAEKYRSFFCFVQF